MTDKQLIAQMRVLIRSMHRHMERGCSEWYDKFKCAGCRYAGRKTHQCKRFEHFEKRMHELGVERFRYFEE